MKTNSPITQQITFLPTRNLKDTVQFYNNILGFELIRDQGNCVIFKTTANAFLGFCIRKQLPEQEKVILTLITEDVDRWYVYLSGKAVFIDGQPKQNKEYGIYHFFFTDPNGYKIEIQRFDQPLVSSLIKKDY